MASRGARSPARASVASARARSAWRSRARHIRRATTVRLDAPGIRRLADSCARTFANRFGVGRRERHCFVVGGDRERTGADPIVGVTWPAGLLLDVDRLEGSCACVRQPTLASTYRFGHVVGPCISSNPNRARPGAGANATCPARARSASSCHRAALAGASWK